MSTKLTTSKITINNFNISDDESSQVNNLSYEKLLQNSRKSNLVYLN